MTNNAGTATNLGNQQVSIYQTQQLASIYGNQLLYGVLQPGVANAKVTITQSADTTLIFTIAAGTELFFQRSTSSDPASQGTTDTYIVKVVLASNAIINTLSKVSWTSGNYVGSSKLYIIADWDYAYSYASFTIANDISILSYSFTGNYSTTQGNQVLVATILNNVVAESHANPLSTAITYFHISYEGQTGRDVLARVNNKNEQYLVEFVGDGSGVRISQGSNFVGENFTSPETLTSSFWSSPVYYPTSNDSPYSNVLAPTLCTTYINNVTTGASITVSSGNYGNYYQVDFLRIKFDEISHTQVFVWESFLQPTNGFTFVLGSTTQQQLIDYLSTAPASAPGTPAYTLNGLGHTLLVSIRLLSAVNTANVLWPESTVIFKGNNLSENTGVTNHSRFKLPVWKASDLGLS
jgi:hypothetical protein